MEIVFGFVAFVIITVALGGFAFGVASFVWHHKAEIADWFLDRWERARAMIALWRLRRDRAPALWVGEPSTEDHAHYRREWERLAGMDLASLDREDRRKMVLYIAEVHDGLLAYGDNPMHEAPKQRAEKPAEIAPPRRFGGVFVSLLSNWRVLAACAAMLVGLTATGWATSWINGKRADFMERQRDEARESAWQNYRSAQQWRAQAEANAGALELARAQTATTAQTIAHERRIARRYRQQAEEIRNAQEQARMGGPPDYGFGSVQQPAADSSGAGGGAGPGAGDPD